MSQARRVQFSLKRLLLFVALAAWGAWSRHAVYQDRYRESLIRNIVDARDAYYRSLVAYEAGTVIPNDVCEASVRLYASEVALLTDVESQKRSLEAHLQRLGDMYERVIRPHDFYAAGEEERLKAMVNGYVAQARKALEKLDSP